jgi:hypothetical protein
VKTSPSLFSEIQFQLSDAALRLQSNTNLRLSTAVPDLTPGRMPYSTTWHKIFSADLRVGACAEQPLPWGGSPVSSHLVSATQLCPMMAPPGAATPCSVF